MSTKRTTWISGKVYPLSIEGTELMNKLSTTIQNAMSDGDYHTDNSALSKCREEVAAYICKLESQAIPVDVSVETEGETFEKLVEALSKRFYRLLEEFKKQQL